jgi:hypothetical protein
MSTYGQPLVNARGALEGRLLTQTISYVLLLRVPPSTSTGLILEHVRNVLSTRSKKRLTKVNVSTYDAKLMRRLKRKATS